MPLKVKEKFLSGDMATDQEMANASTADRNRANHTGTQPSTTISDFDSAVDYRISLSPGYNKVYNSFSSGEVLTTSLTDVVLPNTTIAKPMAGKYVVIANVFSRNNTFDASNIFSIYKGTTKVPGSEQDLDRGGNQGDIALSYVTSVTIEVDGNEDICIRWRVDAGTGKALGRSITLIKVG